MPKRMLDDSYLTSPSLARCSPRAQDAFPRFILLADDFGCFEAFPRVLLAKGWPYRSDVSEREVWGWLEEYVGAGMACLWTEKERRWCYLTGWHGPHGQKARAEYDPNAPKGTPGRHGSKRKTPVPPADLVAAVVAGERRVHDGKPPGVDREDGDENPGDFTPARETALSRENPAAVPPASRSVPAPAVPVPVPVPDADAPKATTPAAPPLEAKPKKARDEKSAETDARFQPFVRLAFDVFAEKRGGIALDFDGHDGKRLREFLSRQPKVTAEEFGKRWSRALDLGKWPGCAKVAHLVERWNELAAEAAPRTVTAPALPATKFTGGRRAL